MDHIKITFADLQPEQKEILIAQLVDAGYEGFEESDTTLDAFIGESNFDLRLLKEIAFKYQTSYTSEKIAERNWNQIWESSFQPIVINDYVAIRADFHQPITSAKFEIVITPKMSFGTGHHATTYMMIELMEGIHLTGKSILDFGTGTGILAILAEKSGAGTIHAIDNDDWSIANAEENFKKNNCNKIILKKASAVSSKTKYDVIFANINKNVIIENLPILVRQLNKDGKILISGLLQEDEGEILSIATELRLHPEKQLIRNNWIALQLHN